MQIVNNQRNITWVFFGFFFAVSPKVKKVTVRETKDQQTLLVTWSYEPDERDYQMAPMTNVTLLWCHGKKMFADVLVVNCEVSIVELRLSH